MVILVGSTIGDLSIWLLIVFSMAGMVVARLLRHALLYLDKGVELAPAIFAVCVAFGETQTQRNCSLVENEVNVFLLFAAEIAVAVGRDGFRGLDNLNVETGAKGGDVCDGEVVGTGVSISREFLCELTETECSEDGNDVGVVGKVKVEALVKGESLRVVIQGDVDLRARVAEGMVLQSSKDFLLIANANCPLHRE